MVGRLPALKYFEAASSKTCQTSSAGWRHDTSACVCTSIAISSFVFIRMSPSSVACLVPFLQGSPLRRQLGEQRRRLPMHGPELVPVFENTVVNRPQANGIGIEQGTAPIARMADPRIAAPRIAVRRLTSRSPALLQSSRFAPD